MTGLKASAVAHFPGEGLSASAARRFVAGTLEEWGLHGLKETACLLVSELVSNVVLHTETDLDVRLCRPGGRLRVEVHDGDPNLPQRKFYSPTSATGRGLVFIAQLSQTWGADHVPGGKVVWFELDEEAAPVPVVHSPGAEFRLEHWEDWEDLTQTVSADDPRPEPSGRARGASGHTASDLVGCW